MSTATEITRLTDARNTIRDKLIDLGLATSTSKLDALATAVDGIANRGAVSATVQEGDTYTIPAGYHNGSGTVAGVAGGGNYNLQSKSITPTKNQQSVTPDSGYYGLDSVTVAAIPEAYQNVSSVTATAADVLATKVIVDATGASITGTMPNVGSVSKTLDATTGNQTYTVPAGKHSGSGTVNIVLENKTATPTTSVQNITPTTGKVLGKVTVNAIPSTYQDVSNVDATAADVLAGKTIVISDGTEVEGTIPTKTSSDLTLSGSTITAPAGYYDEAASYTLTAQGAQTLYPSTSDQTIASGRYLTGTQTIKAVVLSGLSAANIKDGTVVKVGDASDDDRITAVTGTFTDATTVSSGQTAAAAAQLLSGYSAWVDGAEVKGSMTNRGAVSKVLDATSNNQSYTVPSGYHDGNGTVSIVLETKTATPSTSSQNITPTSGKVLSKVTVNAIPAKYGDTTGDTAVAANVLAGVKAHTIVNGTATQITGTMANNGAISGSIDGLTTTSYTVPAGYTSGGTVSLTNDIELALAAI